MAKGKFSGGRKPEQGEQRNPAGLNGKSEPERKAMFALREAVAEAALLKVRQLKHADPRVAAAAADGILDRVLGKAGEKLEVSGAMAINVQFPLKKSSDGN